VKKLSEVKAKINGLKKELARAQSVVAHSKEPNKIERAEKNVKTVQGKLNWLYGHLCKGLKKNGILIK